MTISPPLSSDALKFYNKWAIWIPIEGRNIFIEDIRRLDLQQEEPALPEPKEERK